MSKTIFVGVAITIDDDADMYEVIENCDYTFAGEGIITTEIVQVTEN